MKHHRYEKLTAYLFILPLVLFIGVLILYPVLGTIISSLYRDTTFLPKKWSGFGNYLHLLTDTGFHQSLKFTLMFIFISVPLELLLGLGVALLLHHPSKIRFFLRAACLIPWAVPAAVSARTWELIYNYSYGLANYVLQTTGLSSIPVNWMGSYPTAFTALVIADVWKTVPFVAIILLAGLSAIPYEIYQQARIDGSHFIQRFFYITVPLLKPVLLVSLLFRTIDALRIFDLIYVITSGGPGGSTSSLSLYAFKYFVNGDFGYGSVLSVALFSLCPPFIYYICQGQPF